MSPLEGFGVWKEVLDFDYPLECSEGLVVLNPMATISIIVHLFGLSLVPVPFCESLLDFFLPHFPSFWTSFFGRPF